MMTQWILIKNLFLTGLGIFVVGHSVCALTSSPQDAWSHPLKSVTQEKQTQTQPSNIKKTSPHIFDLSRQGFDAKIIHSGSPEVNFLSNDKSQIGYALLCADLNGDHLDDIVVGVPQPEGLLRNQKNSGVVYVLFGKKNISPVLDLAQADWILYMPKTSMSSRFGHSLAAGDVNGDGIQDLIIGAAHSVTSRKGIFRAGEVYVVLGTKNIRVKGNIIKVADMIISGAETSAETGFALAAGDINGDGKADIIMGAPGANRDGKVMAGQTYVVFGRDKFPRRLSLAVSWDVRLMGVDGPNTYFIDFDKPPDRSGSALATGDINHDGLSDIIVGAPYANGAENDRPGVGEVYVVYGQKNMPRNIDLATEANLTLWGAMKRGYSGYSVAAADVNGDQIDDVIIGTAGTSRPGKRKWDVLAYVVYGGKKRPYTVELKHEADLILLDKNIPQGSKWNFGNRTLDYYNGSSLATGDFNGDGIADMLFGLPGSPENRNAVGYLIQGRKSGPRFLNLAKHSDGVFLQNNPKDMLKHTVAVGDVNGDGRDDLLIRASEKTGKTAGEIYIVFGRG